LARRNAAPHDDLHACGLAPIIRVHCWRRRRQRPHDGETPYVLPVHLDHRL